MKNRRKKIRLAIAMAILVPLAVFVSGEVAIRLLSPTECMHPRYEFSSEYGLKPFANTVMVHTVPRLYQYQYTINSSGCRGGEFPPPDDVNKPTVVVLGDSYSFGMGVNDGEEYSRIMSSRAKGLWQVLNLSTPGWGLTQHIRRYNTVGRSYHPAAVILQFCENDPKDNFINRVTTVENGQFVYRDSHLTLNWLKKYLSRAPIQRSQLYNFFRARAVTALQMRFIRGDEPVFETFYCELLGAFAEQLVEDGSRLIMIAVDGELEQFPIIRAKVDALQEQGKLSYFEVLDWINEGEDYASPEGHKWGKRAHATIGAHLADIVSSLPTVADAKASN